MSEKKEVKKNNPGTADLAIANNAQISALDLSKDSDVMSLMMDAQKYDMCLRLSKMISQNRLMPKHLCGDEAVCFQVVVQSLQWGLNPFSVSPKTYAIGQKLSYESQLVNAVINKLAPTKDRLHFEWFGDWDKYIESGCKKEFEKELGVKTWATLKGEDEPRILEVKMNSIGIRNSTNWKNDPKQQISYVAVQRWSRLYCPDVIMGIYTPDELKEEPIKNITPKAEKTDTKQSDALLGKLQKSDEATKVDAEVVEDTKEQTVSEILEAEIKKSGAPIVFNDLSAYMKKVKAAGPDIETLCKTPTWDKWFRENSTVLVKSAAEWKVTQEEAE